MYHENRCVCVCVSLTACILRIRRCYNMLQLPTMRSVLGRCSFCGVAFKTSSAPKHWPS